MNKTFAQKCSELVERRKAADTSIVSKIGVFARFQGNVVRSYTKKLRVEAGKGNPAKQELLALMEQLEAQMSALAKKVEEL